MPSLKCQCQCQYMHASTWQPVTPSHILPRRRGLLLNTGTCAVVRAFAVASFFHQAIGLSSALVYAKFVTDATPPKNHNASFAASPPLVRVSCVNNGATQQRCEGRSRKKKRKAKQEAHNHSRSTATHIARSHSKRTVPRCPWVQKAHVTKHRRKRKRFFALQLPFPLPCFAISILF